MEEIKSLKEFQALDYEFNESFSVLLRQHELTCEKVLRILPKKRIVILAGWRKQQVVAKLFFSRRAEQHMRREIKGARYLSLARIDSPNIILYGQSSIPGVCFIIYRYVEHAANIQDIWINKQDPTVLKKTLLAMQDILIKQHQNGLYYSDLHPHNFIIGDDRVYLIDPAEVKCINFKLAISVEKSLQNLVVLYSQLAPKFQSIIVEAFRQYSLARGWKIARPLEKHMLALLYKKRCVRLKDYLKKSVSTCQTFVAKSAPSFRYASTRSELTEELKQFFKSPDEKLNQAEILKNGNTCTTFKAQINNKTIVVKRYNIKSFWHFLKLSFQRKSRALRSWENSNALELLCVPSPKPIAFFEKRSMFIFPKNAYYIFEYVEGEVLDQYLPEVRDNEEIAYIIKQLAELLRVFACMRIVHGDMKASNFVYQNGRVYVLDLDATKFCQTKKQFAKRHKKDIDRLLKNWENHPNILAHFKSLIVSAEGK